MFMKSKRKGSELSYSTLYTWMSLIYTFYLVNERVWEPSELPEVHYTAFQVTKFWNFKFLQCFSLKKLYLSEAASWCLKNSRCSLFIWEKWSNCLHMFREVPRIWMGTIPTKTSFYKTIVWKKEWIDTASTMCYLLVS